MALRLCLFLLVNIHLSLSQQNTNAVLQEMKPLVEIPEVVRAYPHMQDHYTKMVDFLLRTVGKYFTENRTNRLEISEFTQNLEVTVKEDSYWTNIAGKQGWMEKLPSLTRVGQITTKQYRTGLVSVSTSLRLKNLTVGFDKYALPIGDIANLAGKMNFKIGKNKALLKALIILEDGADSCNFFLERFKIEELDDIKATITGLQPFDWLDEIIVDGILKDNQGELRAVLEDDLRWHVRNFLKQTPCGNFSPS